MTVLLCVSTSEMHNLKMKKEMQISDRIFIIWTYLSTAEIKSCPNCWSWMESCMSINSLVNIPGLVILLSYESAASLYLPSLGECWHLLGGRLDTDGGESWPPLSLSLSLSLSDHPQHLSCLLHQDGAWEGTISVRCNRRWLHYFIMKKKDETFLGSCFCVFLLSMAGITLLIQLGSNMFIAMDRITIGTFHSVSSLQPWSSQRKCTKNILRRGNGVS